ncbi:hypothetical protein [Acinetobacter sp. ANC 4639]
MAFNDNELLELDKEYTFKVIVKDEDQWFAGTLSLSPKECLIRITGERPPKTDFYKLEVIECKDRKNNFFLFNIALTSLESRLIDMSHGKTVWAFEYEFSIGFIICSKNISDSIKGFSIASEKIKQWVGITNKQYTLMEQLRNPKRNFSNNDDVEFSISIDNYGNMAVIYNQNMHMDIISLTSGIKLLTETRIRFNNDIAIHEIGKEIDNFYALMTLFIGCDFKIDTIKLDIAQYSSSIASFYLPTANRTSESEYPLLPLGLNLAYNHIDLKELPLDCFNNYYQLSSAEQLLFTRYLRYKRMKSDEEKFLGYFRLLEKLTYKKKTYTAICIGDFYDSIPAEIQEYLSYKREDIRIICKLRNNITHANEYTLDDTLLHNYTKFINALLFLALTQKIGIPFDVCIPIARGLERV